MDKEYKVTVGSDGYLHHKRRGKTEKGAHHLFKRDPKGDIEERRVNILYANGFNDINKKL